MKLASSKMKYFRFFFVILIFKLCFLSVFSNATDYVEIVTKTVLEPLVLSNEIDPQDLSIAQVSESDQEDYSSETEYVDLNTSTTEMSSESTISSKSESNEILEMTSNYHSMRVKIVNLTHTIRKQQEIITQQKKKIRDLENINKKKKISSDKKLNDLKIKNENCRNDFNSVYNNLTIAKKIISMEKYSRGLKRKLQEFGVMESM